MPTTKSYIVPLEDLTLAERAQIRKDAEQGLEVSADSLKLRANLDSMVIRDVLPNTDLGLAAQEDWLIAGAGVLATELQYFSSVIANDRVLAFYGIYIESAASSISRVRLTQGATSAQVRGVYQLEQLNARLEPVGYLTEPVYWIRQETARVMVMPRLAFAANTERLGFLSRIIEPIGNVLSAPSV